MSRAFGEEIVVSLLSMGLFMARFHEMNGLKYSW